jgi:23S rRNA U2552 (ribose-2'-O)-methylase RlmE/FtsJ
MNKQSLVEIFAEIGNNTGIDIGQNDKNGIHTYLETYDKLFAKFRNGCTMMEIGLAGGDSVKLWDRYFDNSTIIGVDISLVFQREEYKNNVRLIECDATTRNLVEYLREFTFDLVVEDSLHTEDSQVQIFNMLKHKMKPGGIYIIEDILSIDSNRSIFEALHDNCEILDMRNSNGRFDNVLVIYKF